KFEADSLTKDLKDACAQQGLSHARISASAHTGLSNIVRDVADAVLNQFMCSRTGTRICVRRSLQFTKNSEQLPNNSNERSARTSFSSSQGKKYCTGKFGVRQQERENSSTS